MSHRRHPPRYAPGAVALLLLAPALARAEEARCLDSVVAAIERGEPADIVRAADTALADDRCPPEQANDLRMSRAVALADIARAGGGEAWCEAKDAYAALRHIEDPVYGPAARAGFDQAAAACAETTAPPPESGWREGPLVLLVTGLGTSVLVGGGLMSFGALYLHDKESHVSNEWNEWNEVIDGIEFGSGLFVSGAIVAGVGLALATAGWVWQSTGDEAGAPGVGLTVGPGAFVVQGHF